MSVTLRGKVERLSTDSITPDNVLYLLVEE